MAGGLAMGHGANGFYSGDGDVSTLSSGGLAGSLPMLPTLPDISPLAAQQQEFTFPTTSTIASAVAGGRGGARPFPSRSQDTLPNHYQPPQQFSLPPRMDSSRGMGIDETALVPDNQQTQFMFSADFRELSPTYPGDSLQLSSGLVTDTLPPTTLPQVQAQRLLQSLKRSNDTFLTLPSTGGALRSYEGGGTSGHGGAAWGASGHGVCVHESGAESLDFSPRSAGAQSADSGVLELPRLDLGPLPELSVSDFPTTAAAPQGSSPLSPQQRVPNSGYGSPLSMTSSKRGRVAGSDTQSQPTSEHTQRGQSAMAGSTSSSLSPDGKPVEKREKHRKYMQSWRQAERDQIEDMERKVTTLEQEHHALQGVLIATRAEAAAMRSSLGRQPPPPPPPPPHMHAAHHAHALVTSGTIGYPGPDFPARQSNPDWPLSESTV